MPTSPGVTTVGLTTAHNCIAKPVSHCSSGADRLALPYSISNGQWRDTEVAWQGFPRDSSRQAQVSPPWWERPPACLSASQRGLGFSGAHWKTLLHSFQSNCEQDGGGGLKHSIQIKYPSWKLNKFRITRILYIVHNLGEIFILNTLSMILFFSFYHNVQVCKVCFKANHSECLYDDGQVLQPLGHQLLLSNVHPQCSPSRGVYLSRKPNFQLTHFLAYLIFSCHPILQEGEFSVVSIEINLFQLRNWRSGENLHF